MATGQGLRRNSAIAIAFVIAISGNVVAAAPEPRNVADAQEFLADSYGGKASDYVLLTEAELVAGSTPLWAAKFLQEPSNEVRIIYRDALGDIGGPDKRQALVVEAQSGLAAIDRKASADLLAAASDSEAEDLPVAIWMAADTSKAVESVVASHPEALWLGDRPTVDDIEIQREMRRLLDEARSTVYQKAFESVRSVVEKAGGSVGYESKLAPLMYVDTPAATLPTLAGDAAVRSLGLEGNAWRESLASAGTYVNANWISSASDQGTGVRVAVIE